MSWAIRHDRVRALREEEIPLFASRRGLDARSAAARGVAVFQNRRQLDRIDRLYRMAVETRRKDLHLILDPSVGGQCDQRRAAISAVALAQFVREKISILDRHPDVRNNSVGFELIEQRQRGSRRGRGGHARAQRTEEILQRVASVDVIIDDQNRKAVESLRERFSSRSPNRMTPVFIRRRGAQWKRQTYGKGAALADPLAIRLDGTAVQSYEFLYDG